MNNFKDYQEEISPGIANMVMFLKENKFETTDSGDGSNYQKGMECALPFKHVFMRVTPENMISESKRLRTLLNKDWSVEASYSPDNNIAVLMVYEVNNE